MASGIAAAEDVANGLESQSAGQGGGRTRTQLCSGRLAHKASCNLLDGDLARTLGTLQRCRKDASQGCETALEDDCWNMMWIAWLVAEKAGWRRVACRVAIATCSLDSPEDSGVLEA